MSTNNYKRTDSIEFTKKVSRKIKGWYSNDTFHDKAVNRIALQREEIISLFEKVEKVSVKKLLRYLDSSGFSIVRLLQTDITIFLVAWLSTLLACSES